MFQLNDKLKFGNDKRDMMVNMKRSWGEMNG